MAEKFDNITIHGLPRAFQGSFIERLFWIIIVCAMTTLTSIFLYQICLNYTKREVTRDIQQVSNSEMQFPVITICNNPVSPMKKHTNFSFSTGFEQFLNKSRLFCIVNGVPCNHYITPETHPECIILNANQALYQAFPHHNNAMVLHLFINNSDYNESTYRSYISTHSSGVSVSVANQPMIVHSDPGVDLATGFRTVLKLKKERIKRLPYPFPSNCRKDRQSDFEWAQTVNGCYFSCILKIFAEQCNFIPAWADFLAHNLTLKGPPNDSCAYSVHNSKKYRQSCDCPPLCEEVVYPIAATTMLPWPENNQKVLFRKLLSNTFPDEIVDENFVKNHIARLDVLFDTFEATHIIEREKYPFENLASDIGGVTGVYLGASLISLCELVLIPIYAFCGKKNNK